MSNNISFKVGETECLDLSNYTDVFINDTRVGVIRVTDKNSKYTMFDGSGKCIATGDINTNDDITKLAEEIYTKHYNSMHVEVVWFNNWFSSIRLTIEQLRAEFTKVKFIGSNRDTTCTYSEVVDKYFQEPYDLTPEEYVDFALETCAKYGVTIFFPKVYMNTIAKHKADFETLGVKLVCEDYDVLKTFDSKDNVYNILKSLNYDKIPNYTIANTTEEFKEQYKQFIGQNKDNGICIKFDKDEGAASFRLITDKHLTYESMREKLENTLTYDNIVDILNDGEQNNEFKKLMVMPKILSPEVSVDCYNSSKLGFIAIPRYKKGSRIKEIILNRELIADCERLYHIFNFKSVFNVQYRWTPEGKPQLLEINTRMSGGIHLTSMCGFSIPKQVVADILDVEIKQSLSDIKEVRVTQYETPTIL